MAVIYDTTMSPSKLELLAAWLPAQPWYLGNGREPDLTKAGGFRLDDPEGEVGIEFMLVTDQSVGRVVTYQVPLAYRGRALAGGSGGLIGTSEHGSSGPGGSTTEPAIRSWSPSWSPPSRARPSRRRRTSATRRTPP